MSAESVPKDLIAEHLYLVKVIAQKLYAKMPGFVELDDLIQWGYFGLADAVRRFDPGRGNKFNTFASYRIRGAMFDGMRDDDIASRSSRDATKILDKAREEFKQTFGRNPSTSDFSKMLGLKVDEIQRLQLRAQSSKLISIENFDIFTQEDRQALLESSQNKSANIEAKIYAMQKLEAIVKGVAPIDRLCFMLHYIWGMTMIEIGEMAGCSGSRISQRIAIVQMRATNIGIERS